MRSDSENARGGVRDMTLCRRDRTLRRCAGFASIAALAYWVVGCCEQAAPPPPPPEPVECTGPITITVTGDTAAVFHWLPDCMVGRVLVYEGDELNEKWGVETFGTNIYRSP